MNEFALRIIAILKDLGCSIEFDEYDANLAYATLITADRSFRYSVISKLDTCDVQDMMHVQIQFNTIDMCAKYQLSDLHVSPLQNKHQFILDVLRKLVIETCIVHIPKDEVIANMHRRCRGIPFEDVKVPDNCQD